MGIVGIKAEILHPVLLVVGPETVWSPFKAAFQQAGFIVIHRLNPMEALAPWVSSAPDAILIASPLDEEHLCLIHRLRLGTVIPLIILLTSYADELSILRAYEAGADDVLPLPMRPSLLAAKAMTWVRRARRIPLNTLPPLTGQGLTLDPQTRTVFRPDGQAVRLTGLEFRFLYTLMVHQGQPVSMDRLLRWVWDCQGDEKDLLKRLVYRLRQKLEPDPKAPRFIRTVPGVGYAFGPAER